MLKKGCLFLAILDCLLAIWIVCGGRTAGDQIAEVFKAFAGRERYGYAGMRPEAFLGEDGAAGRKKPADAAGHAESSADMTGRRDGDKPRVALTFDDGPHPFYTEELLDGLEKRGVKATFFVTGEHAELHPEIIKRMYREGHLIGNHTYSHIQLKNSNREKFKEELIKTNEVITKITGEEVLYVRPPYGTWDKKFERELNMFPVLWTVDPLDWCSNNAACVAGKVVEKAKENDIILMHDYYESSVTAALQVVDELEKEGYEFVTVEDILFD